jgi:hypothetical protein
MKRPPPGGVLPHNVATSARQIRKMNNRRSGIMNGRGVSGATAGATAAGVAADGVALAPAPPPPTAATAVRQPGDSFVANDGHDTRAIQAYLGHRSIMSTVRYTALTSNRFKNFWKD